MARSIQKSYIADYFCEVAQGNIDDSEIVSAHGLNTDIDTLSTPEDVWQPGGLYTGFPAHSANPEILEVFSSDANDTAAGTGARTLLVTGLDSDWNVATETFTLAGTSEVEGSTLFHRVHRAQVITAGSGATNAGAITIRHATTTENVFAIMTAGDAHTRLGGFTIPAGKDAYLIGIRIALVRENGNPGSAIVSLRHRADGGIFQSPRVFSISTSFPVDSHLDSPFVMGPKDDIKLTVDLVSDNNNEVTAELDILLVDQ